MNEELKAAISEALKGLEGKFQTTEQVKSAIEKSLEGKFDNLASKEDITKAIEDFSKEATKDFRDMIEKSQNGSTKKAVSIGEISLKDFDAKAFLEAGKNGQFEVVLTKAAGNIVVANAGTGGHTTTYEVEAGIGDTPSEPNVVLQNLMKGNTNSRTIFWVNRKNKEGGSAFIGEGVLKPLMDWEYGEENSVAKKVAVRAKFSTESLKDIPALQSDLNTLLTVDLEDKIEDELLAGAGGDSLVGITTVATAYTTTALDDLIATPNNADAIRAAILQMRLLKFKPNVVFVNPADAAVMDLTKSTTGNYIKIELEGVIRQVRMVETLAITAGNFLLMDTNKYKVKMYEGISLQFGLDGDDFSKNMRTVIAEARLHAYFNSIDAGSMIYEDYATIKAAIAKP
jgi:hypothetical protein